MSPEDQNTWGISDAFEVYSIRSRCMFLHILVAVPANSAAKPIGKNEQTLNKTLLAGFLGASL